MSKNETYDLIKSKMSEDKILKRYNETRLKLVNEGYKTSSEIKQESKFRYESQPVNRIQTLDYAMNSKRFENSLSYQDRQMLRSASNTFVSIVSAVVVLIVLIACIG